MKDKKSFIEAHENFIEEWKEFKKECADVLPRSPHRDMEDFRTSHDDIQLPSFFWLLFGFIIIFTPIAFLFSLLWALSLVL